MTSFIVRRGLAIRIGDVMFVVYRYLKFSEAVLLESQATMQFRTITLAAIQEGIESGEMVVLGDEL